MIKRNEQQELELLQKKYEDQIKLFPESNTFVLLAEILLKQKKIQDAVSVLIKGLSKNKDNITARFLLARVYYQSWNIDLAKKELKKVIKLAPDNYASARLLIEIYKSEEKYHEAIIVAKDLLFYYEGDSYLNNEIKELMNLADYNNNDQLKLSYRDKKPEKEVEKNNLQPKKNVFENETMLNICINQGLYKEALRILNMLILREPDNLKYKELHMKLKNLIISDKN